VAWKVGMASGFFCVRRPGHFELGLEARAHNGIERLVLDLHAVGPSHPLAQCLIGGEAFGPVEGLLQAGEHCRRKRDRFACGDVGLQQGMKPLGGVKCQPVANCVAVDAQQAGHLLAVVGLPTRQRVVWNLLGIGLVSGLLVGVCLPTLLSTEVSAGEIEWVRHFQQRGAGGAWGGTIGDAIVSIPLYLTEKIFGVPFVLLSVLGLLVLGCQRPRLALVSGIGALTVVGLVINSMYWLLPLSYAMYPERVALLLLLPAALGIGALLDGVRRFIARRDILLWGMAALIVFVAVRHNEKLFYKGLLPNTLVSEADLKAMHWIAETTAPGAVVQNRYGDAGLWIPAIAFHPITDPHLSPFFFDEFRAASPRLKASYVSVGKKKLLGEPILSEEFESRPDVYRKVYAHDGVTIYEIVAHATSGRAG
jgi:hypothetical protein